MKVRVRGRERRGNAPPTTARGVAGLDERDPVTHLGDVAVRTVPLFRHEPDDRTGVPKVKIFDRELHDSNVTDPGFNTKTKLRIRYILPQSERWLS